MIISNWNKPLVYTKIFQRSNCLKVEATLFSYDECIMMYVAFLIPPSQRPAVYCHFYFIHLNPTNAEIFLYRPYGDQRLFFQFEIIYINVSVSLLMFWFYGH